MKLTQYLKIKGLTLTAFAKLAGLNVPTAHRAEKGKVMPSPNTMRAIMAATKNKVMPNDFFEIKK